MIGTNIRTSKISFVLFFLFLYLVASYYNNWIDFGSIIGQATNTEKVSLVNLLVASVEAAKRGGDMVKKVKEGKNLEVSSQP